MIGVRRYPSLGQISHIAAYYLGRDPDWTKRHVETVLLRSDVAATRRLTIDVVLPADEAGSLPWPDGQRLYYVPLTTIAKRPARASFDLRDEAGSSLPVLSRRENAAITSTALRRAAEDLAGAPLSIELRRSLHQAVRSPMPDSAEVAVAYAITLIRAEHPEAFLNPAYAFFEQLLAVLSVNSILWSAVIGVPGERKIFKLAYDIPLTRPPIPRRRPYTESLEVRTRYGTSDYERRHLGDRNEKGTVRRLLNRIANPLGLSAVDVIIERPYIRFTQSYHLQVRVPEGLEARRIRLFARLSDNRGRQIAPIDEAYADVAHLYFAGLDVETPGDACVSLRVSRRGFLTYSLVTAALITFMLAVYATYPSELVKHEEVAGAALLIVPALLVSFGIRPGEHPIVASALSGVRLVVLACGIFSVLAALSLVGARPEDLELGDSWRYLAQLSGALTLLLFTSWVLSLESAEWFRRIARRWWARYSAYAITATVLLLAGLATLYVLPDRAGVGTVGRVGGVAAVALLACALAWAAQFSDETTRPMHSRRLGSVMAVAFALLLWGGIEFSGLLRRPFVWVDVRTWLITSLWLLVASVLIIDVVRRRDPDEPIVDYGVPRQDEAEEHDPAVEDAP
jgi:hypothetical protein